MEMKLEKLFFLMLEKQPQSGEKTKEVILYSEMDPAVEKIKEYMTSGVSADDIELTKVGITEKGMKAKVVSWSTIAEALVKKSTRK